MGLPQPVSSLFLGRIKMVEIREIRARKRGCGWRKPGGMYLVGGTDPFPCRKLPIALDVCPVCGAGIKPARGWTWIDLAELVKDKPCYARADVCVSCPLGGNSAEEIRERIGERVGLIWIGERYYPSVNDFMNEWREIGWFSRRIQRIPHGFKVGESWIAFAHRRTFEKLKRDVGLEKGAFVEVKDSENGIWMDAQIERIKDEWVIVRDVAQGDRVERVHKSKVVVLGKWEHVAGIFAVVKPERIEYVVRGDEKPEELERLVERGLTLVRDVLPKEEVTG